MHELGVVFYVVKDVKQVAEENAVEKVASVTLQIGEVSGIIHDYLIDCWNWARKKEPVMEEAELLIESIDAARTVDRSIPRCSMRKSVPTAAAGKPTCLRGTSF